MRDPGNVMEVGALNPDYMGFIFYPPSARHCGDLAPAVVASLPAAVTPVAVSVDMEEERLAEMAHAYGFPALQLHGCESPDTCVRLRERGFTVIKAISVKGKESLKVIRRYEGCADMYVLDTATSGKGGSGRKFDWDLLVDLETETDFLLSGGISPDDAVRIMSLRHPRMAGIDLNSRFEIRPGLKDVSLLRKFLHEINEYKGI